MLLRDVWRSLRRSPGFALLTISILAIGIALNTTIFAVVDCLLLRPLGYHNADRIVALQTHDFSRGRVNPRIGGEDFVDAARDVGGLQAAAYYQNYDVAVQVRGSSSVAAAAFVSPQFGEVMGVQPVAGRLLNRADATGSDALVSEAFAREHFDSPQAAIGKPLHGPEQIYTIVGVLPAGFAFPGQSAVWLEAPAQPKNLNRTAYNQQAVALRREGTTAAQLSAELASFSRRLQQAYPEDKSKAIEAVPLQERIVGRVRPALRLLMGSAAVVLLILCANIVNLQMLRSARSVRENAVRSALGASKRLLAMRGLLEAAMLSVLGCAGALLLAQPALRMVIALAPAGMPRLTEIQVNWQVMLYSLLASFVLMAVTALLPAWRSWHVDQSQVLRQDTARGLEGKGAKRLREGFLTAQVACTLVLAAAAVLLARQLIAEAHEDLGFNMEHLYVLNSTTVEPPQPPQPANQEDSAATMEAKASADAGRLARMNDALATLRAVPGVSIAEAMDGAPLGLGWSDVGYAIRGRTAFTAGARLPDAEVRPVTPGALSLLHVPLLHGRALNEDDRANTPRVLLVSEALANKEFRGEDPIGKQIMCGYDSSGEWWTIVGVVGSIKDTPGTEPQQTMYIPLAQHPRGATDAQYLVRTVPGANLSEEASTLR